MEYDFEQRLIAYVISKSLGETSDTVLNRLYADAPRLAPIRDKAETDFFRVIMSIDGLCFGERFRLTCTPEALKRLESIAEGIQEKIIASNAAEIARLQAANEVLKQGL